MLLEQLNQNGIKSKYKFNINLLNNIDSAKLMLKIE